MKTKIFKILKYLFFNGFFGTMIYFGLIYQPAYEGALNVALFIAWYIVLVSCFLSTDTMQKVFIKTGPSVPLWIDNSVDLVILITFVWHSHTLTAVALFFAMLAKIVAWDKVNKTKRKGSSAHQRTTAPGFKEFNSKVQKIKAK